MSIKCLVRAGRGGLDRFRAEAHHAGSLSHPNIAQVFDYAEPADAEPGYLVMELVDGLSLSEILDDGPLTTEDVMDVVAQSVRGLAAAHRTGLVSIVSTASPRASFWHASGSYCT